MRHLSLTRILVLLVALIVVGSGIAAAAQWSRPLLGGAGASTTPSPYIWGSNLSLYNGNDFFLTDAATQRLAQQMHVQTLRIPDRGDLATVLKAARIIQQLGMVPLAILPYANPAADRQLVQGLSGVFGNQSVWYEYGNERDGTWFGPQQSAQMYTASWNSIVPTLKQLAPSAKFVGPAMYHADAAYLAAFVGTAQPRPDAVSWHEYTCSSSDSDAACISAIDAWSQHIGDARAAMRAAIGQALPIMITEYNWNPINTPDNRMQDAAFIGQWTQRAIGTLVKNLVFAANQYVLSNNSALAMISDETHQPTAQGQVFQQTFEQDVMQGTCSGTPTATATTPPAWQSATPTASSTAGVTPSITTATTTATASASPSPTTPTPTSSPCVLPPCASPTSSTSPTVGFTPTPTSDGPDETAAWKTATPTTSTATTTPGPTPTSTPCPPATPCASPMAATALPCPPTTTATTIPQGPLHTSGTQIVDGSGHAVILRGSQIESGFNYIKQWQSGKKPTSVLTSAVFQAMAQKWKMNVLRVPLSNWIYNLDPAGYLGQLDQVVAGANAAGLYVILDLHDSAQSGSPYGKGQNVPKTESVAFWKVIAAHYKANPMVLFDPFNEPQTTSWQEWLHGGKQLASGATEVGYQDLVKAIRGAGAQQIIILEPGSSGKAVGQLAAEEGGWSTFPLTDAIADSNVIYSLHVYSGIVDAAAMQDAKWGPVLGKFPVMYGEWGLVINTYHPVQCRGVAHDQADEVVSAFLNYMDARGASWVAWDFAAYHLIEDTTTFTPTTLDTPWTCGDIHSHAGMGTIVMQHLLQLSSGTGQGSTPPATATATP